MINILSGNASSVIVDLYCHSVIDYRNAYVDLVRYGLAFEINIFDRIRKEIDYGPYDKLGITVKQRIDSVIRQRENNIIRTGIILDV